MITTADSVPLNAVDKILYIAPDITVYPSFVTDTLVRCDVRAQPSTGTAGQTFMDFDTSTLDALTPTTSSITDDFMNVCEQAVVAQLEIFYGTPGGFTIV